MTVKRRLTGWRASKRRRQIASRTLARLLLIGCSVVFVVPFAWLVSTSLKVDSQIFTFPPIWVPNPVKWSNYVEAFRLVPMGRYFLNTLYYCGFSTAGTLLSCPLVAYSFARIRWPGRDVFFLVMLSTMMIPFQVSMIPLFVVFKKLGWINTYLPLIIPHFFGTAFFIFLLRQFFMTIPQELSDSAKIDGCSELRIYFSIILRLAKPALATVALFQFLDAWRNFVGPLIYLNEQAKYPISVGLQQFKSEHSAEWSLLMAASTVVTLPIIVLYFFAQKTFIQGITVTGMGG